MVTQLIYETKPYQKSWEAKITNVYHIDNSIALSFNETIFYPEGGGQPFDTGFISVQGVKYPVKQVLRNDQEILHFLDSKEKLDESIIGKIALQNIDWDRRIQMMRWHSGEHLFSGIILKLFGSHNKGFHIGRDGIICDYDRYFDNEEVSLIYEEVTEAILSNQEIKVKYPLEEELEHLSYRSKKEIKERLRVISVGEYDHCACCGTHVAYTGEIGMLKIISKERFKNGTRFHIVFGKLAARNYYQESDILKNLSEYFSTNHNQVLFNVYKLRHNLEEAKLALSHWQERYLNQLASEISDQQVFIYDEYLDMNLLKKLGNLLSSKVQYCLLLGFNDGAMDFCIQGEDASVQELFLYLKNHLRLKGGGRGGLVCGRIAGSLESIKAIWEKRNV